MAEHRPIPSQDPAEGARDIVEHELERSGKSERKDDKSQSEKPEADLETDSHGPGDPIVVPTPVEPGDQNAQTTPP